VVNNVYEWLDPIRIVLNLAFLSYASWHDYRSREVSNKVWAFYAPLGLTLTLLHVFMTNNLSLLLVLGITFSVFAGITIPLFYLGFFGGADVKAFLCISLAMPFPPISPFPYLGVVSPLYGMSIFGNAVIVSALTAVAMVLYNLFWYARTGTKLFEGLGHEPTIKKLVAMFTGYKIEVSEFRSKLHLAPMEEPSQGENGRLVRTLRLFIRTDEDREAINAQIEELLGDRQTIWVTPYLPFIVFITIGFVLTLLIGDVLFGILMMTL
jgi:preflagellin peptidase FlaK